jgi:membrane associated rhomboid family serine protease
VGKVLFIPFSLVAGVIAGFASKKLFDVLWGVVDDEEPPEPEHRDVSWAKLAIAAALQGAIFRMVRALTDRGSRLAFSRFTGEWPGEEEPEETG